MFFAILNFLQNFGEYFNIFGESCSGGGGHFHIGPYEVSK